jgi:hypothetical protein
MEREEAIKELKLLEGVDLVPLAGKFEVTIWKGDKKTKDGQVMYLSVF